MSEGSWFDSLPRLREWVGDRHVTSAAPARSFSCEDYQRALDVAKALGPPPPRVEFFKVPGSTDVAVLVDDTPTGILTAAQFEELRRRLEAPC